MGDGCYGLDGVLTISNTLAIDTKYVYNNEDISQSPLF